MSICVCSNHAGDRESVQAQQTTMEEEGQCERKPSNTKKRPKTTGEGTPTATAEEGQCERKSPNSKKRPKTTGEGTPTATAEEGQCERKSPNSKKRPKTTGGAGTPTKKKCVKPKVSF